MVSYPLSEIPLVCQIHRERIVDRSSIVQHRVVELCAGPLDGKRIVEEPGGEKISHNPHHVYSFEGVMYRPWKLTAEGVLMMRHAGES